MPAVARPEPPEYAGDFGKYIQRIPECDLVQFLRDQLDDMQTLLAGVSTEESLVHHAPYTWSIRQVVGHMSDCERVFGYRALRLARHDATPLAGFDENRFMAHAHFGGVPLADLVGEFASLRRSHIGMLAQLADDDWTFRGMVRDHPMSTRAMAYAIAGHAQHHLDILHKRLGL